MLSGPRRRAAVSAAALCAGLLGLTAPGAAPATAAGGTVERFVVLYRDGATLQQARRAVGAAGGRVLRENRAVRFAVVETRSPRFRVDAGRQRPLAGVARDRYIGYTPPPQTAGPARAAARTTAEQERAERRGVVRTPDGAAAPARTVTVTAAVPATATATAREPLAPRQWDMRMLRTEQAHQRTLGDRRVTVGVIDTGIEASHPDIAANFDRARSRNFVRDIPRDPTGAVLDGPCEVPSCVDPVDRDDDGHGTHVASTVAAPVNGVGIAGVAPGVRVANLRAGQDSGWFFLVPVLDAISHAGDVGVDVVTLSFYIDPWLFNCAAHPSDSPAEQEEQRVVVAATQRAVTYAWRRGVTLLSAAGNGGQDLGRPGVDATSPGYPQGRDGRERALDDRTCLSMPSEAAHVLDVTAVGPSGRRAHYSDYGVQQAVVAAPGGDAQDTGTGLGSPENRVLGAYPARALRAEGLLQPDGDPVDTAAGRQVLRAGDHYWRYLQGTSMAAPHAAGVAALVVSAFGTADRSGGLTLAPVRTEQRLTASAAEQACPSLPGDDDAVCEGTAAFNGFYGHGVVDALAAVAGAQ